MADRDTEPERDDTPKAGAKTAQRHPLWLHLLLFGLTCVTTTLAVGLWAFDPAEPWAESIPKVLSQGGQYAGTLMAILLAHEMGHYLTARHHKADVSLPYFLPGPTFFSLGTFGAFIRMGRRIEDRQSLFDIGLAGPLAGLAVALPALWLGLSWSTLEPLSALRGGLFEGNSLLYLALKRAAFGPIPAGFDVSLHPVAFAGWMGLLVTALNLFPVGQLDGGHIAYALMGPRRGTYFSRAVYGSLIGLALGLAIFERQFVWVVWAVVVGFIGFDHPPVAADRAARPLGLRRSVLGYLALALFVVTFPPIPLSDTPPGGWGEDGDAAEVPGVRSLDSGLSAQPDQSGRGPERGDPPDGARGTPEPAPHERAGSPGQLGSQRSDGGLEDAGPSPGDLHGDAGRRGDARPGGGG